MNAPHPTLAALQTAHDVLLNPHGLTEAHIRKALSTIRTAGVDDADLYFQYTRSQGWSLEEGIVKSGSFSIDQGVGVRAVHGEKTAFAYSDDLSWPALLDAAKTVRTIAAGGQTRRQRVGKAPRVQPHHLYQPLDPIASLDNAAKVALLQQVEQTR